MKFLPTKMPTRIQITYIQNSRNKTGIELFLFNYFNLIIYNIFILFIVFSKTFLMLRIDRIVRIAST